MSDLLTADLVVPALLVGGALLLVLRMLHGRGGGGSPRALRAEARRLRIAGQHAQAGELYLEAGDKTTALDVFLKAGLLGKAAPLLEERGEDRTAAESYEAARDCRPAGRIWGRLGDHARAAENYEAAEAWADAARHWQAAGDPAQAGNAWWQDEEYEKAASIYHKAGMLTEAGEAYRYLLQRALSLDGLDDALSGEAADPKVAELARACGRTLASAGDYDGAIDALLKGGLQAEAVPLLERAGRIEDAAKLELEAGNLQRAADLFEKAGEHRRADTVRARLALKAGKADKAAALLERSGDLERAAGLWAKSGDYARAASLHEQRREWLSAAQAWQRAKRPAKAAAALERLGDRRRAADLYRKIGDTASELRLRQAMKDHLSVARILLASGDEERAEEALRRVTEGDRGHRAACSLLGDLYRKRGRPSAATVRYRQAVQGTRPDERSAEVFYHLGCCAEEAREPDLAKAAWAALREWDPTYRDVEERFEAYRAPQTPDPVPPDFDPTEPVVMEELRALPDVSAMQELRSPSEVASGRYERMETLGAGGTSAVYRAKDKVLGREVALKVLVRLPGKEEVTAPDRFLREARSAAALNHPNIVTIFDFGEEQGDLYIAMEFVKGMTLRGMVREGGALGLPLIRSVLLQMCDALDYAHGEGLMHRDIKPANLMWTGGQRLKITDFGLAKLVRDDGSALMSKVLGTPYYMSPEQIRGQEIDPRTDLYSLGVSLYELATARVPFGKGDILKAHLRQRPASPGRYRDDMPQWLEDAILRCLAKEPGDRFPSARALRAAVPGASQG